MLVEVERNFRFTIQIVYDSFAVFAGPQVLYEPARQTHSLCVAFARYRLRPKYRLEHEREFSTTLSRQLGLLLKARKTLL